MLDWATSGKLIVVERLLAHSAWETHGKLAARSGPVEHERATGKDEQNDWLAGCNHSLKQLLLVTGQVQERARRGFTGHVARFSKGEDGDVGILCGSNSCGESGVRRAGDFGSLCVRECRAALLCSFRHGLAQGSHIAEVVGPGPGADHIAGIVGARPDESCAIRGLSEGQEGLYMLGFVLQQDGALRRGSADERAVLC